MLSGRCWALETTCVAGCLCGGLLASLLSHGRGRCWPRAETRGETTPCDRDIHDLVIPCFATGYDQPRLLAYSILPLIFLTPLAIVTIITVLTIQTTLISIFYYYRVFSSRCWGDMGSCLMLVPDTARTSR